ncbi:MAG: hypothetical protein IH571_01380, partial [Acholeplasmataceae bacterium]|nr:hypothetical protein [Acholeplasmataceae bacterium]
MKLMIDGITHTYEQPMALFEVAQDLKIEDALAATVNGRLRELSYIQTRDGDLTFLKYDHGDAIRIYESTLRYVIAMAIHRLYPKAKIKFNYSISRSILAVLDAFDEMLSAKVVETIDSEVRKIIATNHLITRKRVSVGEATRLYTKFDMMDKVAIMK